MNGLSRPDRVNLGVSRTGDVGRKAYDVVLDEMLMPVLACLRWMG